MEGLDLRFSVGKPALGSVSLLCVLRVECQEAQGKLR